MACRPVTRYVLILATRMSPVHLSVLRCDGRTDRDIKPQGLLKVFVEIPLVQNFG